MGETAHVAVRERRTQAERSASTRKRLLQATVECLDQLGYAGATTPEIARRAGLSRGAQLHHFPTRTDLVVSAFEHLFERRRDDFLRAFRERPQGSEPIATAIDILWTLISGPTFHAWLELVVAARTDPELKPRVAALTKRLMGIVVTTFRDIMPPPATPNPFYDIAPRFAFALMDGLALERIHA